MATTAEASRLLRVAPGTVWETWRDLPRWPQWQPETIGAMWLSGQPWADGSTFDLLRRPPWSILQRFGSNRRFRGRVLSTAENQLLVWELTPTTAALLGPTLVESIRLEPAPGGTTITHTITAHGLLPTLVGPLGLQGQLQQQASETLDGLQQVVQPTRGR
jgi:hypothetical protein